MKIGSATPYFIVKSGVQLRIFNAKLDTNPQICKYFAAFFRNYPEHIAQLSLI